MSVEAKTRERLVEKDHLAAVQDKTLELFLCAGVPVLCAVEQAQVIRRLLQLHRYQCRVRLLSPYML